MRLFTWVFFMAVVVPCVRGQWVMEESNTTASLRGIDNAGGGIAWASGAGGTVLRTTDEGKTWRKCATPTDAEKLDFRGIQGFDEKTAVAMSSGPGDQSRIYKTSDGCLTWRLVFTNPDAPNGFFDAIRFMPGSGREKGRVGELIGDPVNGNFATFRSSDYGQSWIRSDGPMAPAVDGETLFAASNSSLLAVHGSKLFVTGGSRSRSRTPGEHIGQDASMGVSYVGGDLPLAHGASAGAFSVAARVGPDSGGDVLVAVGGDYQQPEKSAGTSATSTDAGLHWSASETSPHGYRSAVAYDTAWKMWITVGPNGTDLSSDDGHHWRVLRRSRGEAADADKNWNALSLPYAVGANGELESYAKAL